MGNNSTTTASSPSSTSIPATKSAPPINPPAAITTTATSNSTGITTAATTTTASTTPITATTSAKKKPTLATVATAVRATTNTTTPATAATTITNTAITTTPTPTITSTASTTNNSSTTTVSTAGTVKPTFYSVAKSLTADADKAKSAYAQWYKWSKFEQQKREKGKVLWYMGSPITTTDPFSQTTTTLTTTTAKIGGEPTESSDASNISALPSYLLRSTAVYSPPHGDRVPSGRSELINTDTSVFKYYMPENRSKPTPGIHTKATMYKMDTQSKQTPLPTQASPLTTNKNTRVTGENAPLPTFVSRGLQTDFEPLPTNSSSTQIHYYEKQPSQIVPISTISNPNLGNNKLSHSKSQEPISQPVLPSIEKTPVWFHDRPYPSTTQPLPSYPVQPPASILKNSSTVLSREISNPLSEQTHDRVLEELRKSNKDGTYRIKKVHILEKNIPENHPPPARFDLPPSYPPTKAKQSISRSERLFSSQLFNQKK